MKTENEELRNQLVEKIIISLMNKDIRPTVINVVELLKENENDFEYHTVTKDYVAAKVKDIQPLFHSMIQVKLFQKRLKPYKNKSGVGLWSLLTQGKLAEYYEEKLPFYKSTKNQ